jgi:hypothetical protein
MGDISAHGIALHFTCNGENLFAVDIYFDDRVETLVGMQNGVQLAYIDVHRMRCVKVGAINDSGNASFSAEPP